MRRSTMAVLGTALGTALMIGAKLGHPAPEDESVLEIVAADDDTEDDGPQAPGSPAPGVKVTKTAVAGPTPTTATTRAPAPAPGGMKNGTYSGPGVKERYGVIKVTIVVSGGKITSASATCTDPCTGDSREISEKAFRTLNARTITAQSASISTVSEATYTSIAYKQSLAAAINLAKA